MTDQLIENRLSNLTPEYRSFIESSFVTDASLSFAEKLDISGRKVEVLENAFYLYLLSFIPVERVGKMISDACALPLTEGIAITYAFVSSLPPEFPKLIEAEHAFLVSKQTPTLATEIAETEKAFENLQGIRTMAGDMREVQAHSVPTYQSTQADLIRPTTTPPPPNTGPRWETDK